MRSRGRASPAGLTWPHRPAIPVIVICAAPTNAGGGKAVPAGAEAGCPGLSRYGPGGNSLLQAEPALGTGGGSGLRCGRPGGPAQLQGGQKPLSAAGQGPKQDGRRFQRGSCSVFCVSCHRLFGSHWPLKIARKWSSSKNWSRQLACARTFAGRIRPGRAAATRTKVVTAVPLNINDFRIK